MSNLEKAAWQALDALENLGKHTSERECDEAIDALRAALEQAEPVVDAVLAERKACMDLCVPYINSLNERVSLAALNIFDAIRARRQQAEPEETYKAVPMKTVRTGVVTWDKQAEPLVDPVMDADAWLRQRYGGYKAHPEWRALAEAFNAGMSCRQQAEPVVVQKLEKLSSEDNSGNPSY